MRSANNLINRALVSSLRVPALSTRVFFSTSSSCLSRPFDFKNLIASKNVSPLNVSVVPSLPEEQDVIVSFVTKDQIKEFQLGPIGFSSNITNELKSQLTDFGGDSSSKLMLYLPNSKTNQTQRVLLVGLGDSKKINLQTIRIAVHEAVQALKQHDSQPKKVSFLLPKVEEEKNSKVTTESMVDAASRILLLSSHYFDKYLTKESRLKKTSVHFEQISLVAQGQISSLSSISERALAIASGTVMAREVANERAHTATPEEMENKARAMVDAFNANHKFSDVKIKMRVLTATEMKARGLTLLAAVGQGAKVEPRLVILEYLGAPSSSSSSSSSSFDLALVGKGITFDAGGLNLKPTGSIEDMHLDKSGSAAVLGTFFSLLKLTELEQKPLAMNIVACLALAENAIDANAYKPHSIYETGNTKSKNGRISVEINNTDAEGRLALVDAFSVIQQDYKPSSMIDIATLTGACCVALGEYAAGLFCNEKGNTILKEKLVNIGDRIFERVWPLPILSEHSDELKGTYSDLRSTGAGRYGGASTAAAFLQEFVGLPAEKKEGQEGEQEQEEEANQDNDIAWVHLDIAGPAMYSKPRYWFPQNGTGFGAQLLTEICLDFNKEKKPIKED